MRPTPLPIRAPIRLPPIRLPPIRRRKPALAPYPCHCCTRPLHDGRTALDLALATHEEGEQGAEEQTNAMALPPDSALVLSLLQQMEDEQFEADEQAAVAEVQAQAITEVDQAARRKSEALSPTQRK